MTDQTPSETDHQRFAQVWDATGRADTPDGYHCWPTPNVALALADVSAPPALPLDTVFPPAWAAWIRQAAGAAGSSIDYVATALLAGAAGLIGNARWGSPRPGWSEPTALWAALIGVPSANKSPAVDQVAQHIHKLEASLNADWLNRVALHKAQKQAATQLWLDWKAAGELARRKGSAVPAKPVIAEIPPAPQRKRIVATDTTVAKAEQISAANPRGMLYQRDELAGLLGSMGRHDGAEAADRSFWLQTYGGRPHMSDRVKHGETGVHIPHLIWSIVGTIQPDRFATQFIRGDNDGFTARFLLCWPDPKAKCREQGSDLLPLAETYLRRLLELPWNAPDPVVLSFESRAVTAFQAWCDEVEAYQDEAHGLLQSWIGKMKGFTLRLATTLELLAWACETGVPVPSMIGLPAVQRAICLVRDYFLPMARRAFGEAALPYVERDARIFLRWLLRQPVMPATVNVRQTCRQASLGMREPQRLEAALEELEAFGVARRAPARNGGPGRTRNDWAVNPLLKGYKIP